MLDSLGPLHRFVPLKQMHPDLSPPDHAQPPKEAGEGLGRAAQPRSDCSVLISCAGDRQSSPRNHPRPLILKKYVPTYPASAWNNPSGKAELRRPFQPTLQWLILGPTQELIPPEDAPEQIRPDPVPSGWDPAGNGVSAPPEQPGLILSPGPGFVGSCRPKELGTKV